MKATLFSLFATALIAGILADQPGDDDLPYFDKTQLSETFRRYEVTGCSGEVNNCLKDIHQSVSRCATLWKQQAGDRYTHCITTDQVVVNASRDFQRPSQKWHKAMDDCLSGNNPPSVEALQSVAVEAAVMAYFSRRKRDTPTADDVTACWREVRQKYTQCKQKAAQCTEFAHCYGEGPEPSDENAKRWYNYVKKIREETKAKARNFTMHMGHCLRNEPHTDHGGHGHHGTHGGHEHRAWN